MHKQILTLTLTLAFAAVSAMADSNAFQSISRDAASIQKDAAAIALDLKSKKFDAAKVKSDVDSLGKDIAALRKDVETLDANLASLTPQQKEDWALVKTKVQLLTVFHERKATIMNEDMEKNRSLLRALSDGIAKRAKLLQQTADRLGK